MDTAVVKYIDNFVDDVWDAARKRNLLPQGKLEDFNNTVQAIYVWQARIAQSEEKKDYPYEALSGAVKKCLGKFNPALSETDKIEFLGDIQSYLSDCVRHIQEREKAYLAHPLVIYAKAIVDIVKEEISYCAPLSYIELRDLLCENIIKSRSESHDVDELRQRLQDATKETICDWLMTINDSLDYNYRDAVVTVNNLELFSPSSFSFGDVTPRAQQSIGRLVEHFYPDTEDASDKLNTILNNEFKKQKLPECIRTTLKRHMPFSYDSNELEEFTKWIIEYAPLQLTGNLKKDVAEVTNCFNDIANDENVPQKLKNAFNRDSISGQADFTNAICNAIIKAHKEWDEEQGRGGIV